MPHMVITSNVANLTKWFPKMSYIQLRTLGLFERNQNSITATCVRYMVTNSAIPQ